MLYNASTVLNLMSLFRITTLGGRPGSGKTSLAFRLAFELVRQGKYRYIISNCPSVWNEQPEKVVLRSGRWADAVFVLDEAGTFLKAGAKLDTYIAYMRKLNVCIILPTFLPPSSRLKVLTIQRTMNWKSVGLPVWQYTGALASDAVRETFGFLWINPHEIFGIYDTNGFPSDDGGLEEWLVRWTQESAVNQGYKAPTFGETSTDQGAAGVAGGSVGLATLFEDFDARASQLENSISAHAQTGRGRRKRRV